MEPYKITPETCKWATRRCEQLYNGIIEAGTAMENLTQVLDALKRSADEMDDQPESDMVRSFIRDYEMIKRDLEKRIREWSMDRKAINIGLQNLLKGEK